MANRTVKDAHSVRGTNPQYLVEKIIRSRIYDSRYWKEECFALTAELLVDKAMELRFIGGVYGGNVKPAPFLCLLLKMLQIQPEKDIVVEFIRQDEFKYVRALGANYMRLVGSSLDCYKYLEPLYNDYRKLRRQNRDGGYTVVHMDEFIDELLREERVADIILPRIQKRQVLEENGELDPRVSALEDDLDDVDSAEEDIEDIPKAPTDPKKDAQRHRSSQSQHTSSSSKSTSRSAHTRGDHRDKAPPKEHRDFREPRDFRDSRDFRELRDIRDSRDFRGEGRDFREPRDKDYRDHREKEHRDHRDKDYRDKDFRDKDYREKDKDYREKDKDYREKDKDYRDKDYREKDSRDHHSRRHRDQGDKRKSNK
ncbi:pre-mRNA processing factor 38 [Amblyomma americanum]